MTADNQAILMGSDHAAFRLKEVIKTYIIESGLDVEDVGTHSEDSVDYPDFAVKLASRISCGKYQQGILLCGTGLGMSMAANKFPYVRAALCNDLFSAIMSKRHNNANILVMGGRVVGDSLALEIVKTWLKTPFEGGRHRLRIDKFDSIERMKTQR